MTQSPIDTSVLDIVKSFIGDKMDEPQIKSLSDDQRTRLAQEIAEGIHALIEVGIEFPDCVLNNADSSQQDQGKS
jgi:hypothetical protein